MVQRITQEERTAQFRFVNAEEEKRLLSVEHSSRPGHAFIAAKARANRYRNRYCDILPFDETRVKLQGVPDYINASFVKTSARMWIATQGPLPGTMHDFWRMQNQYSQTILMLCNVVEKGRRKCAQYFPNDPGMVETFCDTAGARPFQVTCAHLKVERNLEVRQLQVRGSSAEQKNINHLHYTTWPDFGTSDVDDLLEVLQRLDRIITTDEPVIIHCSAGCGRTGTMMALDALRKDPRQDLAILVDSIRQQRIACVQTYEQFQLLCDYQDSRLRKEGL